MKLSEAKNLEQGQTVYHRTKTNADSSPMRAKVTSVKIWKRSPDRIEIGLKHGLYDYTKYNETEIKYLSSKENFIKESDFTRVNSDINGNPRYVIHFLRCCPDSWKKGIPERYEATCKLMNKIGGRKFHNKQYGGGIVFQSHSIPKTITAIENIMEVVK